MSTQAKDLADYYDYYWVNVPEIWENVSDVT